MIGRLFGIKPVEQPKPKTEPPKVAAQAATPTASPSEEKKGIPEKDENTPIAKTTKYNIHPQERSRSLDKDIHSITIALQSLTSEFTKYSNETKQELDFDGIVRRLDFLADHEDKLKSVIERHKELSDFISMHSDNIFAKQKTEAIAKLDEYHLAIANHLMLIAPLKSEVVKSLSFQLQQKLIAATKNVLAAVYDELGTPEEVDTFIKELTILTKRLHLYFDLFRKDFYAIYDLAKVLNTIEGYEGDLKTFMIVCDDKAAVAKAEEQMPAFQTEVASLRAAIEKFHEQKRKSNPIHQKKSNPIHQQLVDESKAIQRSILFSENDLGKIKAQLSNPNEWPKKKDALVLLHSIMDKFIDVINTQIELYNKQTSLDLSSIRHHIATLKFIRGCASDIDKIIKALSINSVQESKEKNEVDLALAAFEAAGYSVKLKDIRQKSKYHEHQESPLSPHKEKVDLAISALEKLISSDLEAIRTSHLDELTSARVVSEVALLKQMVEEKAVKEKAKPAAKAEAKTEKKDSIAVGAAYAMHKPPTASNPPRIVTVGGVNLNADRKPTIVKPTNTKTPR